MSLSSDLLAQARVLIASEPRRPKQASLRRAVSTAYYSLFHLFAEDAAQAFFAGADAAQLRLVVRRAFQHATMKKAAQGVAAGNPPELWKRLFAGSSSQLQTVASNFVELQEARHQADYDPARRLTRAEAADLVERAEDATKVWMAIRRRGSSSRSYSREAKVFLAALLLHDQVARR